MIFRQGVLPACALLAVSGIVSAGFETQPPTGTTPPPPPAALDALGPDGAAAEGPPLCTGTETPEGEVPCFDDYVDTFNAGPNSVPSTYTPIVCGQQFCGELGTYLSGGIVQTRDTDWYLISLLAETEVTWSVTANGYSHQIAVYNADLAVFVGPADVSVAGETLSQTFCLPPGHFAFVVATTAFSGVPCGSEYVAELSCAPCPEPNTCPADFDGSGDVGFGDLLQLLGAWGPCPGCPQDLDGSGDVGFADLLQVLGAWGPCPGPPTAACCLIDDTCVDLSEEDCATAGGNSRGEGTECASSFCAPDCNGNGIPDPQDVLDGAPDCNLDEIPDECQDCDGNGLADQCDIESGASDCNEDGIPDACGLDCDLNGVADECDILSGDAQDCNGNGVPDLCEIAEQNDVFDCNGNGVPDKCDIANGTVTDLNGDEVPDQCSGEDCNGNGMDDTIDIYILETSADCNANGIPDECEPDCNGNGQPDDCDVADGTSLDCNGNGSPDECDIASGASLDFSPPFGVPDECVPGSCPAICDAWVTIDPNEDDPNPSFQDFAANPIPAGFFDPGSLPFDGLICLAGQPIDPLTLGETDTLVSRPFDPFQPSDPPSPVPAVVPIQITSLKLVSCEPITVHFEDGSTSEWDVEVRLSDFPQLPGQMMVVKTHPDGGFFDSSLPVLPKLVFRRVGAASDVRIFDAGVEGLLPIVLENSGAPWVHFVDPLLGLVTNEGFVPGIEVPDIRVPVEEESNTGDERHRVRVPCVQVVDLDIWNGLDGACDGAAKGPCGGQAVPDAVEVSRGAVTVANLNDTDGDGTIDRNDGTVVPAGGAGRDEVDLMRIVLRKPSPDNGGSVTLSRISGNIKVWESSTKGTEVPLPKMYPTSDLPKTLWVEARAVSPMLRDIHLRLTYMGKMDDVKATGAWTSNTLNKLTRAAAGAANTIPADCGPGSSDYINSMEAADGSRYGAGTFRDSGTGTDTKIGGRILMEFTTAPVDVETLGVRWDVTRRIKYRDFAIADGSATVSPTGMKDFPTENETPNDDSHAQEEDNTPSNQKIYGWDNPSYPIKAGEAYIITRNTFKEYTRARIHPNGAFVNKQNQVEGSRSSNHKEWYQVDYLVRQSNGNRGPDTMNPSASFPLRMGTGTGGAVATAFAGAVTEGWTCTYDLANHKWTCTGTTGSTANNAVGGAVPAGTTWTVTVGAKVKVVITQGATAFANGDQFKFSTFKATAAKQNVINCGSIDPTDGP